MHNFSAGPAVLPKSVLQKAQSELLDIAGTGSSVMELSHRSKEFEEIHNRAINDLKSLCDIPDDYSVLFMQGGATMQFSCIVYNLSQGNPVDYCVSGAWSDKAFKEAVNLGANSNKVFDSKPYVDIPDPSSWKFSKDASYIFYVSNETIHGVEPNDAYMLSHFPPNVPVVCDMSSNILSRKIDVSRYACIFAGAQASNVFIQKNMGPAGLTVVILKKSLLNCTRTQPIPVMLDYRIQHDSNSLYNTPPTFAIYLAGLVYQDLLSRGGIDAAESAALLKSGKVYAAIEKRSEVFSCPVASRVRSRINIPFRILVDGKPNEEAETKFLSDAADRGMSQLKGHRSVGGIRASLYNALEMEAVDALVELMSEFSI